MADKEAEETQEQLSIKNDRITYGCSRKVSDGDYGSYDYHCSYSTDVKPGESVNDAAKRAIKIADTIVAKKIKKALDEEAPF